MTQTAADTSADTHISPAMLEAAGRLLLRRVSYPVSESDIRKWALAVYYPESPPRHMLDAVGAARSRAGGLVAAEEFNPFAWRAAREETASGATTGDDNDPGRTEKSLGLEPPAVRFMLNGGLEVDYGVGMRPGDVITSNNRLASYSERRGRLGLMLFTVFEDTWTNQDDEMVKTSRSTLIRY